MRSGLVCAALVGLPFLAHAEDAPIGADEAPPAPIVHAERAPPAPFSASSPGSSPVSEAATFPAPPMPKVRDPYFGTVFASLGTSFSDSASGATYEVGVRPVATEAFWAHAQVQHGGLGSMVKDPGGSRVVLVGVEARHCSSQSWFCGTAGVDVGYYTAEAGRWSAKGPLYVPRLGLDTGGHLRFRFAFVFPRSLGIDETYRVWDGTTQVTDFDLGSFGVHLAIAGQY